MALPKFKNLWVRGVRKARDGYSDTQEDIAGSSLWFRVVLIVLAIYLLIAVAVGIYWSLSPGLFDVRDHARQALAREQHTPAVGTVTTATLIRVAETLWDKPGGYLSNDIMPPGLWLDDMPNWEYGVLIQVRDMSKAMREAFSRSQSQSREDKDLILAEPRFNFDNASWIFPASPAADLTLGQQTPQVDNGRIGTGNIRSHYQRVIGEHTKTTTVQYHRAEQGLLGCLQFANNLLHTDLGVFIFQYRSNTPP